MIGMSIAYEWHNRRIGSFLMESALEWATDNDALKLLWLEVYSTNIPGIKLYEKYGFKNSGLIRGFINDSGMIYKITMVKYI